MMNIVNLQNKLALFSDYWNPRIVGELNNQYVKLVKLKGEFTWHKHTTEDELFFVIKGKLVIEFRDKKVELHENEFIIVQKGVEHKPIAEEEVHIMLFEPVGTINTGGDINEFTKTNLENI